MIWEKPEALFLLLLLPLLLGGYWLKIRSSRKQVEGLFEKRLLEALRPGFSTGLLRARLALLLTAGLFLITGFAGPKLGTEVREIEQKGVDLLIALDLSRSMNVEDIRPSRLEKAKFEISRLIQQSEGNRIGLLVFTGEAFLQSPLTLDHSALRMFLDVSDTRQMPSSTTNFTSAFEMAAQAFRTMEANLANADGADTRQVSEIPKTDQAANVLLLISDGEDQSEGFENALKALTEEQITVFSVGIGSEQGGPIPVYDDDSGRLLGYHRSQDGTVVNSRLQRAALQKIASLGEGEYYEIGNSSSSLDRFLGKLDELKKGTFSSQEFVDFKNQYQWMVGAGLLMLTLALFIPETRSVKRKSDPNKRGS